MDCLKEIMNWDKKSLNSELKNITQYINVTIEHRIHSQLKFGKFK